VLQADYIRKQSGSEYAFDYRLASLISISWVVFTYSIVTPLLYPISFLIFFVFYWKDKYFLLKNYYKRP